MPEIKKITKDDISEVKLIGVYLTQKIGMPTAEEIIEVAEDKLGCIIDKRTLERALHGASKQDIIARERKKIASKGGQSHKVYSMKRLNWHAPPEYAHVSDLLPELIKTSELKEIKSWFDSKEKKGESKGQRGNVIDNYEAFEFTAMTLDPLLGSQIACEYSESIVEEFKLEGETVLDVDGVWQRDGLSGEFIIAPDILQGWFASNAARYIGLADSRVQYVAFAPVRFTPHEPPQQYMLPVNNARQGASAPKPYEAIPAGQMLEFRFTAPTKGFLSPTQIEYVINMACLRPRRGFSPARGRRFGRAIVKSFTCLGSVKEIGLSHLTGDIPSKVMEEHGTYFRDAIERLRNVRFGAAAEVEEPSDPFPSGNTGSNGVE